LARAIWRVWRSRLARRVSRVSSAMRQRISERAIWTDLASMRGGRPKALRVRRRRVEEQVGAAGGVVVEAVLLAAERR
jgi:hypothetical protein